jgi:hypothetical protein
VRFDWQERQEHKKKSHSDHFNAQINNTEKNEKKIKIMHVHCGDGRIFNLKINWKAQIKAKKNI